jgi:hypothetical protein
LGYIDCISLAIYEKQGNSNYVKFRLNFIIFKVSNHDMLMNPKTKQIIKSFKWRLDKTNRSLRNGMYNTIPKKTKAPNVTYHKAKFGDFSVFIIVRVQELLVKIVLGLQ